MARHAQPIRSAKTCALSVALIVAVLLACERAGFSQDIDPNPSASAPSSALATMLQHSLSAKAPTAQIGDQSVITEPLRRVYEARGYAPIWSGSWRAKSDAKRVLDRLAEADKDGLQSEDYRLAHLSAMRPADDGQRAEFDLLMTDSLLRYAHDMRVGRARPLDVDEDIELPEIGFDFAGVLSSAVADGTLQRFLAELAPKHPEYQRLRQALARYRAIETAGGWPAVPGNIKLDEGNAEELRARLAVEDSAVTTEEDIVEALKRYQANSGLAPDGKLGQRTLAALNIPVGTRIQQIVANMERWRWMPRELEPRRIAVNVADATLQFIDAGTVMLDSNVVVGTPNWRTPILRTDATAVTVNPVWHVPTSIARREIWPKLQRDPSYLERQGFVVVNGQIRQAPGPGNALGQIKLEMPNDFRVYLHDTPTKSAFIKDMRALSHGCVRVEQIGSLASLVLTGDVQSGLAQLAELVAAGMTTKLDLAEPIPVYLLYWTAIADDDGRVAFRSDVYERDRRLIAALEGGRLAPPGAVAELDV